MEIVLMIVQRHTEKYKWHNQENKYPMATSTKQQII